ncbi:DUF3857 domain-containing protein [Puniceicoccus vermicola]|uniref:DUF3857 domain-containing protein n=1 Tax=Puniceicoccus vermicola TaxID=388746 RepID=A0A7X1E6P7_9BACT|nr:transglutaminase domain-containing protein [Puniceicoccus vermicola]MBC2604341.1 DUF3857 domain-containing protein [Puniceicoccus vermicola]
MVTIIRVVLLALISLPPLAYSNSGALIVVGLSGDNRIAEQHKELAGRTAEALKERGIPEDQIRVLITGVTRQSILDALDEQLSHTVPGDEFWLVLLGHGGLGRDNEPLFQVRGPRLKATDLREALLKYPSLRPVVLLGFDRSGGFLPHFEALPAWGITATSSAAERNLPRFTAYLVEALEDSPQADIPLLTARAAERTQDYYESHRLARTEESRLYDPQSGEFLQPPFGVSDLQAEAGQTTPAIEAFSELLASEIEIPKSNKEERFTELPASEETRALIAEAKKAPNPAHFSGLILRREIELTVTPSYQATRRERLRVYLANEDSFDQWANYQLPMNPPVQMSRIESARLILPDGRSRVMGRFPETDDNSNQSSINQLYFPGVEPGSLVEVEFVTDSRARQDIPAYYTEIPLQLGLPILSSEITLNLPADEAFHFHLANLDTAPTKIEDEQSRKYTWQMNPLPAYEPLPYDPDPREWAGWLGVSSIPSWEQFTDWFSRISEGAFEASPEVVALAESIAADQPDQEDRIRAAYEYVSAMRYTAIEIGVQAFRPRTPGQVLAQGYGDCKDKANLLTALLREMDIPAQIALINRFSFTEPEFPGWQFNHAIAYVEPTEKHPGGLWLDATERTTSYGELAPGNAGRQALIIDQSGEGRFRLAQPDSRIKKLETWTLTPDEGRWSAIYNRVLDNALQRQISGKSPQQRNYILRAWIKALNPSSQFEIQTVSILEEDHTDPAIIRAQVSLADGTLPQPSIPWRDAFLSPVRDRPLQLGEAPTQYTQVITMPAPPAESLPDDFRNTVGSDYIDCRIIWSRSNQDEILRSAVIEIREPVIPSEAYPAVRKAFREWWQQLNYDFALI